MTNPLTWSGIKYILIWPDCHRYNELNGKSMIDRANPLSLLFEDKGIDHSNLSFFERLDLTNNVLVGNHFDYYVSGEGSKGIIDLLIFPLVSRILCYYMVNQSTPAILRLGAGIVGVPLEVARHVTAFALTVAVAPLVFLAHVAFKLKNTLTNLSLKNPQESLIKTDDDIINNCSRVSFGS